MEAEKERKKPLELDWDKLLPSQDDDPPPDLVVTTTAAAAVVANAEQRQEQQKQHSTTSTESQREEIALSLIVFMILVNMFKCRLVCLCKPCVF